MKTVAATHKNNFQTGIANLQNNLSLLADTYADLMQFAVSLNCSNKVLRITKQELFERALRFFGPQIIPSTHRLELRAIYDVAIHLPTGAIIVSSKPTSFPAKTLVFSQDFITHFQAIAVYMPGLGVEIATVARIGEIKKQPFVLRSESACAPSFLFGSKNCNCASQWRCTQELAAYFNSAALTQVSIGFLMIHLENQNGMGMGYTSDIFATDLGTRAHLRQAAGLATSQHFQLSIKETFDVMGMPLDPRRASEGAGYKIAPILLDFLETHSEPILLSNNPLKIQKLKEFGYFPHRLRAIGENTKQNNVTLRERANNFGHLDIGPELTTFESEFKRLIQQIQITFNNRSSYVS